MQSNAQGHGVVMLAQLKDGNAFGEEALLSEGGRNANVTPNTDGLMMHLSKSDFEGLLKGPMLHEVNLEQAKDLVRADALLLDVRLESEHKVDRIKDSVNIPLYMLRLTSENLDKGKKYVCDCETGRRASAQAYLLTERGFGGVVLSGGLQAIPKAAGNSSSWLYSAPRPRHQRSNDEYRLSKPRAQAELGYSSLPNSRGRQPKSFSSHSAVVTTAERVAHIISSVDRLVTFH